MYFSDATFLLEALKEAERRHLQEVVFLTTDATAEALRLVAALGFLPYEYVTNVPWMVGFKDGTLWKAPTDSKARELIKRRDPRKQTSKRLELESLKLKVCGSRESCSSFFLWGTRIQRVEYEAFCAQRPRAFGLLFLPVPQRTTVKSFSAPCQRSQRRR